MTEPGSQGVRYEEVGEDYFARRKLRRYAGVFSLWALGVGAVISGHFSGWNYGLGFGWGSMFVATIGPALQPLSGSVATLAIALVTIYFQVTDAAFQAPVLLVAAYYALMILYFAGFGRTRLVRSPEEEFALSHGRADYKTH
jgi:hypothetical protein